MIGLDTNVLVRYIVEDDPAQSRQAKRLIEGCCTRQSPGLVDLIVLCELVWVLKSGYDFNRLDIIRVIRQILSVERLSVDRADLARQALHRLEAGTADFADYLIGLTNRANQGTVTYTFDRNACESDLFQLVPK